LRGLQIDIIHGHYSYSAGIGWLAFSGKPVIVSFMGADVYGSKGVKGNRYFKSLIDIYFAKILQLFVDGIIVKSPNLYNDLIRKKKAMIIPNGVNFKIFKPRDKVEARKELNLPLNKKLIVFLGHPTYPRKNFKLLEEAVSNMFDPGIEIVNPYPTTPDKVPIYLNAADVLVLTSESEGSPNVIKEAMASNVPIVSTDVGDVSEVIAGTSGCFITSPVASEVASNIKKALDFGKYTNGRENIKHLEISAIARQIMGLYQHVLDKKRN